MVWGDISLEGRTDLHIGNSTAVMYCDKILRAIVRLYAVAARSSWCRTLPGLLWPECVACSWMIKVLMPLIGPLVPLT